MYFSSIMLSHIYSCQLNVLSFSYLVGILDYGEILRSQDSHEYAMVIRQGQWGKEDGREM